MKVAGMNLLKKLMNSGWILGLIIALPIILTIPELFDKYKVNLVLQESPPQNVNYRIHFRDLNGNGIKQKVYVYRNDPGQLTFQYFDDNGAVLNRVSFPHKYTATCSHLLFGDANKNGIPEIYGFTLGSDSLFINWTELKNNLPGAIYSHFIAKVGVFNNGSTNVSINRLGATDLDEDGRTEIVISVTSGYSRFPRMIVSMDPETGETKSTKDVGINPFNMTFWDMNNDKRLEILSGSSAGYNLADSINNEIIDNRPYLMAFKPDLTMLFPPVPFTSGNNNNINLFVISDPEEKVVVFQFNRSLPEEKVIGIYTLDFKGNLKDSVFLPDYGKRFNYQVFHFDQKFWLYTGDKVLILNQDFEILDVKSLANSTFIFQNPVMRGGNPEFITTDHLMTKACIYTENFRHRVELRYSDEKIKTILMDIGKGPDYFMVQTNSNEYTYQFKRNGLFYLKYPIYLLIYLFSAGFVWGVQYLRERQLHEKFELKNQLKELEIKYLRMQMDPHFMFNAFTTMALMIKNGEKTEAFDSFMKFTRMLRSNFDFSNHLTRPLSEELQTVKDYLEINKLRFKERLNYEMKIAEDVPVNALIPKMIIQIHVENSLKHGLSQQEKPGFIRIEVTKNAGYLHFSVEDNGIGRKKAAALNKTSTKQGIKMLEALMERLNTQNKQPVSQSYTDLQDGNGNAEGTRVDILVPLNLKGIVEQ